jgi:hypothetical protein
VISNYRSEYMLHKRIRIPLQTHMEIMNELGKLDDCIQFVDINTETLETRKNFSGLIKTCDDMEKAYVQFERIVDVFGYRIFKYESYDKFINDLERDMKKRNLKKSTYFDLIRDEIEEDERRLGYMLSSHDEITDILEMLLEKKAIYAKMNQMLVGRGVDAIGKLSQLENGFHSNFSHIAGVIKADDELRMGRMIFRVSKGRAVPSFFDFTESVKRQDKVIRKRIFTITYIGGESAENVLYNKLIKVCDLFGASRYTIPSIAELPKFLSGLIQEIDTQKDFLKRAEDNINNFIQDRIGDVSL